MPRIRLSCMFCTMFSVRRSEDRGHSMRRMTFQPVSVKSLWYSNMVMALSGFEPSGEPTGRFRPKIRQTSLWGLWSGEMTINIFSVQCFFQNDSIIFHPQSYPVLSKPNFKTQGIAFHLFYHPQLVERICCRE